MIQIKWKSFSDYDLTLEVDDGSNEVTPMTPSGVPFVTSGDDSQDMFTPIRYQTGRIGIVGTLSELEQLIGSYPLQRPVTLYVSKNGSTPAVMWSGYVQSATYSQSWHSQKQELTIPVVSRIGILEYVKIPQATVNRYNTFAGIISEIANLIGGFSGYVFPTFINPATTLGYSILMRNFAKRDTSVTDYNVYITDSYDIVLSQICTLFGLVCVEYKNLLCFIAPDYVGNYVQYSAVNLQEIDNGMSPTNPTTLIADVISSKVMRADNSLSYFPGKRIITVTGKVNPFNLEPLSVNGDEMPLGDTLTDSWGYLANHPDTYFTKCFHTDQYAFMDVMGVGEESNGEIVSPSPNKNVRFLNFGRKKVYNDEPNYGCSFVCEREYYGDNRIAITGSYDQDTGWKYKTLLRVKSSMIATNATGLHSPLVVYKSRERLNYSYLWCFKDTDQAIKGAKYLSINGSVSRSTGTTLQHEWQGATGYFYAIVRFGTDTIYSGQLRFFEGKFSGGYIANQYGSFAFERKGFVIQLNNNQITERSAQLTIGIYAYYDGLIDGLEDDDYYAIEDFNVSIENRWTELDAPMNEREQNSASEDTQHGWVEDMDVDIQMTTAPDFTSRKISAQFGEGIILANDVMDENPHVLYDNKSSELALKDRLISHYADSKKMLEAKVGMVENEFGPLQPWQTHSPDYVGNWCVLSQTIDWRDEIIEGMFFER
jgi:hypothetical protein